MLWIDATRWHIEDPARYKAIIVIILLSITGLAAVGFAVLGWSSRQRLSNGNRVVIGSVMLSIQCTFWDSIYWTLNFPW